MVFHSLCSLGLIRQGKMALDFQQPEFHLLCSITPLRSQAADSPIEEYQGPNSTCNPIVFQLQCKRRKDLEWQWLWEQLACVPRTFQHASLNPTKKDKTRVERISSIEFEMVRSSSDCGFWEEMNLHSVASFRLTASSSTLLWERLTLSTQTQTTLQGSESGYSFLCSSLTVFIPG